MDSIRRFRSSLVAAVLAIILAAPLARAGPQRAGPPADDRLRVPRDAGGQERLRRRPDVAAAPRRASKSRGHRPRVERLLRRRGQGRAEAARAQVRTAGRHGSLRDADSRGPFRRGTPELESPAGTALEDLKMADVGLPVTVSYGHGAATCAIDENWKPSGELASVNPGGLTQRDHTGVTLGYWAAAPDQELKDWVLSSTTLEVIQNPAVVGAIAAGALVTVAALCALACGFFPIACALCPAVAVGAGGAVIDEITSIDADSLESDKYVGFGHFIDMKPTPAGQFFFDTKPAKFMERAGPAGAPDPTESLVTALFDLGGVHVNHSESLAPRNYEILLGASGAIGADFHRNTTHRDQSAWETPTIPHLQLTAVDNLGMFGYREARIEEGHQPRGLSPRLAAPRPGRRRRADARGRRSGSATALTKTAWTWSTTISSGRTPAIPSTR